jgi:hypothetical protein
MGLHGSLQRLRTHDSELRLLIDENTAAGWSDPAAACRVRVMVTRTQTCP